MTCQMNAQSNLPVAAQHQNHRSWNFQWDWQRGKIRIVGARLSGLFSGLRTIKRSVHYIYWLSLYEELRRLIDYGESLIIYHCIDVESVESWQVCQQKWKKSVGAHDVEWLDLLIDSMIQEINQEWWEEWTTDVGKFLKAVVHFLSEIVYFQNKFSLEIMNPERLERWKKEMEEWEENVDNWWEECLDKEGETQWMCTRPIEEYSCC